MLDGYVMYDNTPMLRLLRSSGHPLDVQWAGGKVLSVQLTVESATADGAYLPQ